MIARNVHVMDICESICGICRQTSTIYGITRATNRSDGGGFAWIDSGRRRQPPRNTHNVMLSPPQSLFFVPEAIFLRFKPLSFCVGRWYGQGGVDCCGISYGRVVYMYGRRLVVIYMSCGMYQKSGYFEHLPKKVSKIFGDHKNSKYLCVQKVTFYTD